MFILGKHSAEKNKQIKDALSPVCGIFFILCPSWVQAGKKGEEGLQNFEFFLLTCFEIL